MRWKGPSRAISILTFSVAASLRRLKPDRLDATPARRLDADLGFADAASTTGPPLLLDTTVYIDTLARRAPPSVKALLTSRLTLHSAIALAELTHALGRLSPGDPRTKAAVLAIQRSVELIPKPRLSAPSVRAFGEAGIVAGTIARLRGVSAERRQALLNDVLLFLHAAEQGAGLLTRNIADFDIIQQVVRTGDVVFYQQVVS